MCMGRSISEAKSKSSIKEFPLPLGHRWDHNNQKSDQKGPPKNAISWLFLAPPGNLEVMLSLTDEEDEIFSKIWNLSKNLKFFQKIWNFSENMKLFWKSDFVSENLIFFKKSDFFLKIRLCFWKSDFFLWKWDIFRKSEVFWKCFF